MTLRAVYDRQKKHNVVEVAFRGIPYAEFDRTGISILTVLITNSPHVHDAWSMITRTVFSVLVISKHWCLFS